MLYIPSAWWHEVTTEDNFEGMSIGINYFFEPNFLRRRIDRETILHESRFYYHLKAGVNQTAKACSKECVCFVEDASNRVRRRKRKSHKEL